MDVGLAQGIILVAAGGAIGAVCRFGAGQMIGSEHFPWATFAVNIIGSFLLAALTFGWPGIPGSTRLFLFTGFFGAFTTMSTFTVDTVTMLFDGKVPLALANFLANAVMCVAGAAAGRWAGLAVAGRSEGPSSSRPPGP